MNAKQKVVLDRIEHLEEAIAKGREYLETGVHAKWHGFRPYFTAKLRNGVASPPHPDWVRNVFIPRCERALKRAEKALQRLQSVSN